MKSFYVAVLGMLVVSWVFFLAAVPTAFASDREIVMEAQAFSPQMTTIHVGQRVTWRNHDKQEHFLTSSGPESRPVATEARDLEFNQQMIPGSEYSHAFKEPGVYAYFCAIHEGMSGTIVVKP
jgi:plastocyanin